jgi:hypothetical protein
MSWACLNCGSERFDEVLQYLRPCDPPSWLSGSLAATQMVEIASIHCPQGERPPGVEIPPLQDLTLLLYVCASCGWTLPVNAKALLAP